MNQSVRHYTWDCATGVTLAVIPDDFVVRDYVFRLSVFVCLIDFASDNSKLTFWQPLYQRSKIFDR